MVWVFWGWGSGDLVLRFGVSGVRGSCVILWFRLFGVGFRFRGLGFLRLGLRGSICKGFACVLRRYLR